MADRFEVGVRIELNKLAEGGGWTGERMSINETFNIGVADWAEVAAILGAFHALAEKMQKAKVS